MNVLDVVAGRARAACRGTPGCTRRWPPHRQHARLAGLRPLQEEAIEPLLAGDDALLLAPTAGGKTEAAVVPAAVADGAEGWDGPSVLYLAR